MSQAPFYRLRGRQIAFRLVAQDWLDTPFRTNTASPGVGVDCVRLAQELAIAAGVCRRFALPRIEPDRGWHVDSSQLRAFIDGLTLPGRQIADVAPDADWLVGDLAGVRWGRVEHHLVTYYGAGRVIHAIDTGNPATSGVQLTPIEEVTAKARIRWRKRVMEVLP